MEILNTFVIVLTVLVLGLMAGVALGVIATVFVKTRREPW